MATKRVWCLVLVVCAATLVVAEGRSLSQELSDKEQKKADMDAIASDFEKQRQYYIALYDKVLADIEADETKREQEVEAVKAAFDAEHGQSAEVQQEELQEYKAQLDEISKNYLSDYEIKEADLKKIEADWEATKVVYQKRYDEAKAAYEAASP